MVRRLDALAIRLAALVLFALIWFTPSFSSALASAPGQAPTPGSTPQSAPPLAPFVGAAVMATDVKGATNDPVGITDTYSSDQKILHAVVTLSKAPSDTVLRAVWLTSTGSELGELSLTTSGSRNVDFTFQPAPGKMPAGNYRVDLYVNDNLDRTLFCSMGGAPASPPGLAPTSTSSGIIQSVTMAADTTGADLRPVNPTSAFQPNAVFHAVVAIVDAPANTKFTAKWYVTDVGNAAAPDTLIDSTDLTADGTRSLDFDLTPSSTWPAGQYRVEISVDDQLAQVVQFSVGSPTTPTPGAPAPAPTVASALTQALATASLPQPIFTSLPTATVGHIVAAVTLTPTGVAVPPPAASPPTPTTTPVVGAVEPATPTVTGTPFTETWTGTIHSDARSSYKAGPGCTGEVWDMKFAVQVAGDGSLIGKGSGHLVETPTCQGPASWVASSAKNQAHNLAFDMSGKKIDQEFRLQLSETMIDGGTPGLVNHSLLLRTEDVTLVVPLTGPDTANGETKISRDIDGGTANAFGDHWVSMKCTGCK